MEAAETFMGGKISESERRARRARGESHHGPYTRPDRPIVVGAVERRGRIRASVVKHRNDAQVTAREFVLPGSMIFTDDWTGYSGLSAKGRYHHRRINHSERIYVAGPVHTHSISAKWLPGYLNEWVWKWNHRKDDEAMFRILLGRSAAPGNSVGLLLTSG